MIENEQMNNSTKELTSVLRETGFFRSVEALPELYVQAAQMGSRALLGSGEPRFACLPSFIPARQSERVPGKSLMLDIGGTSTKAALRIVDAQGAERWVVLFEKKNRELRLPEEGQNCRILLEEFARAVATECKVAMEQGEVVPNDFSLAIVWSNPMQSLPCKEGITAEICNRELYNKNEWFIEGLNDGEDIGSVFLASFERTFRVVPSRLLVANDCSLTLKAGRSADGGVVASTGVNGTILAPSESGDIVCNAEIGQTFHVSEALLSEFDQRPDEGLTNRIECLIGGRFLPRLFIRYIRGLGGGAVPCLRDVASMLAELEPQEKWYFFRGKDLSFLERGDFGQFISRRKNPKDYSREGLECLQTLAAALFHRAACLSVVVALGSVAARATEARKLSIAIDSRLAREVPAFWQTFRDQLAGQELIEAGIETELLEPLYTERGSISVPMRGAGNALDNLMRPEA